MKFSMQIATAAVALSLVGFGAANADTYLNYSFDIGSYYDFSGGPSDTITGSFTFDTTTEVLSNVNYVRGADVFTVGSVTGPGGTNPSPPTELFFGDTTTGNYDVLEFQNSLNLGGTDPIVGGFHPSIVVTAAGSITSGVAGAVPEPASWALMLMGFGLVGGAVRSRKFGAAIGHAH